VSTRYVGI